jgi:hypothetical protein
MRILNNTNFWYTRDPIALVDLDTSETTQTLRDGVEAIRNRFNRFQALGLYYKLKENADQAGDLAGIALTQLLLADAMARCGALSLGAYWARRSALCFTLLGDKHNALVAHLLLGLILHITERRGKAQHSYREALTLSRELASNAKEVAQTRAGRMYTEISTELEHLLRNVSYPVTPERIGWPPSPQDSDSAPADQESAHPEISPLHRRWYLYPSYNWCYAIGLGYLITALKDRSND